MATKRTKPEVGTEENVNNMIDREVFDWGVRLTAHPFRGTADHAMTVSSEIRNYRARRGSEVLISFPAASMQKPLRLLAAQDLAHGLGATYQGNCRRPDRDADDRQQRQEEELSQGSTWLGDKA